MKRAHLLEKLADRIAAIERPHPVRVAIDGADAAGKTILADELVQPLLGRGFQVIRASLDGFHHPREVRYQRGFDSPEGYFHDSFDYRSLHAYLLKPLGPGGDLAYRTASFDSLTNARVNAPLEHAQPHSVLLFDGVFLLRPRLLADWDYKIFLEVDHEVILARAGERDAVRFGGRAAVEARYQHRYLPAQRLYLSECRPKEQADVLVLNNDPANPALRAPRRAPHIGTLTETSLHAGLKAWYTQPGDRVEVRVGRFVIDLVRDDLLIEIQTANFSGLRRKLSRLLEAHRVHLLVPIAQEKWIIRQTASGNPLGRRRSPRRGRWEDVFYELVYLSGLLDHPNLTLEVLLTQEEEIRRNDGRGSWRRKGWSVFDRRLLAVVAEKHFQSGDDYLDALPGGLPPIFTNRELADSLGCSAALARKMTYTLRKMDLLVVVGKYGNASQFEVKKSCKI